MMVHHENHHREGGGERPNVAAERIPQHQQQQQLFDSYPSGMAVTLGLGYPFTPAQWKELERQAMIYKCMVANVPVPSELLLPLTTDPRLSLSSGYSLKFGRDGDPEPGRCKRTDGKKWRCSRDAAPDQKYCERHLNRGRPRSRKPVEVSGSTSNKKSCHGHLPNPSPSAAVATNPSTNYAHGGVAARTHAPVFLQGTNHGGFQHATSLFPHKDSRGLDWLMIGEPQPQQLSEETLNLNSSCSSYDNGSGNDFNECLFSLNTMEKQPHHHNTETTRGFIDAWSDNSKHAPSSATAAVHEKLSLSMDDEMGRIHMGLGVTNWDYNTTTDSTTTKCQPSWVGSGSWISSTPPGGPLGEVLHHRTSTPSSPSSRVLPNKLGSLSDSSGEGSVEPEITLQWFS